LFGVIIVEGIFVLTKFKNCLYLLPDKNDKNFNSWQWTKKKKQKFFFLVLRQTI